MRLTLRTSDRDAVSTRSRDSIASGEYRYRCPVCCRESLVGRPGTKIGVFCEGGCAFTQIRRSLTASQALPFNQLVPAKPIVRLRRDLFRPAQVVRLDSIHASEIVSRLYARKHRYSRTVKSRYPSLLDKAREQIDRLFERGDKCTPCIPIGWCEIVDYLFRTKGLRAEVFPREGPLPKPDQIPGVSGTAQFVHFILNRPRGVVRVRASAIRPASLVAAVAAAWPSIRVIAVTRSCHHADRLRQELLASVSHVGLVTRRDQCDVDSALVVAEADWISYRPVRLEHADIVLVLDATLLTRQRLYDSLLDGSTCRLYGLLPVGHQLRPFEDDRISSLFGFRTMTLLAHSQTHIERIAVRTVTHRCGVDLSRAKSLAEVKRWAIWRNVARNRLVAKAAKRLVADLSEERDELDKQNESPWLVGIVVENPEHATSISALLPDWPQTSDIGALQKEMSESDPPRDGDGVKGVVVTLLSKGIDRLAGIVRADGCGGALLDQSSVNVYRNYPRKIVDVFDRHHPRLKRMSRSRMNEYRRLGCFVNGVAVEDDAVQQFLEQHPPLGASSDV